MAKRLPESAHTLRHCPQCNALTDHRVEYIHGGTYLRWTCLPCDALRHRGGKAYPKFAEKKAPPKIEVCPNCFLQVSVTGACGCD